MALVCIPLVLAFGIIQKMVVVLFGEEMFIVCNNDFGVFLVLVGKTNMCMLLFLFLAYITNKPMSSSFVLFFVDALALLVL